MHANHFRRLALAQGLLPSPPPTPTSEQDDPAQAAVDVAGQAAPPAERATDAAH